MKAHLIITFVSEYLNIDTYRHICVDTQGSQAYQNSRKSKLTLVTKVFTLVMLSDMFTAG